MKGIACTTLFLWGTSFFSGGFSFRSLKFLRAVVISKLLATRCIERTHTHTHHLPDFVDSSLSRCSEQHNLFGSERRCRGGQGTAA